MDATMKRQDILPDHLAAALKITPGHLRRIAEDPGRYYIVQQGARSSKGSLGKSTLPPGSSSACCAGSIAFFRSVFRPIHLPTAA